MHKFNRARRKVAAVLAVLVTAAAPTLSAATPAQARAVCRRVLRRVVAAVAGLIVATGVTLVVATPAQAAYPACTTTARFKVQPEDVGYPLGVQNVPAVASNSTADCELWQGLSNSGVTAFQRAFNQCYARLVVLNDSRYWNFRDYMRSLGYPGFPNGNSPDGYFLAEDGQFGPMTFAAVKGVQFFHNLSKDGRFGPQSRKNMNWNYTSAVGTICRPLVYPYVLA